LISGFETILLGRVTVSSSSSESLSLSPAAGYAATFDSAPAAGYAATLVDLESFKALA